MKNIAVFFGGTTVERDVSVITGVLTLNALDENLFNPVPVYISKGGGWYTGDLLFDIEEYKNLDLKKLTKITLLGGDRTIYSVKGKKIKPFLTLSAAINCLHGERGEDGSLAGALKLAEIPLASPDLLSSGIAIDKCATKRMLKGMRVSTLPYVEIKSFSDLSGIGDEDFPLVVKPARSGSSFGITKVKNRQQLSTAYANALRYDDKVLAEKCAENFIEINCAAYCSKGKIFISECERPKGKGDILSFSDKYSDGEREFPAKIDQKISNEIKRITEKVYKELDFSGIIRIDYIVEKGKVYLNEINSVPGSLAYYLFSPTIEGFKRILAEVIEEAEKKFNARSTLERRFVSAVLDLKGAKS